MVEDGGCDKVCPEVLECGHPCPRKSTLITPQFDNLFMYFIIGRCHPYSHSEIMCYQPCTVVHPCGHTCRRRCFEVSSTLQHHLSRTIYKLMHCRTVARVTCQSPASWPSVVTHNKCRVICLKKSSAARPRARTNCRAVTNVPSTAARCVPRLVTSTFSTYCRAVIT